MKRLIMYLATAVVLAVSGCSNTSSLDVVGGTETGNPDISACASLMFRLMNNKDDWEIERYFDSSDFDPGSVERPRNVAKRRYTVNASDTVLDTTYVFVVDTVIVQEQDVAVYDTIYRKRIEYDTLTEVIDGREVVYREAYLSYDTVIKVDTLTDSVRNRIYDTLTVIDTVFADSGVSSGEEEGIIASEMMLCVVPLESSTDQGENTESNKVNPGDEVFFLAKDYTADNGALRTKEFRDYDGDFLLFSSDTGLPAAEMRGYVRYSKDEEPVSERMAVFSSGPDSLFSTVNDNRVDTISYIGADSDTILSGSSIGGSITIDAALRGMGIDAVFRYFFDDLTHHLSSDGPDSASVMAYKRDAPDGTGFSIEVVKAAPPVPGGIFGGFSFRTVFFTEDGRTGTMTGEISTEKGLNATAHIQDKVYNVDAPEPGSVSIREK